MTITVRAKMLGALMAAALGACGGGGGSSGSPPPPPGPPNQPPIWSTTASTVFTEESLDTITTLLASDPEGVTVTFSIVGGADAARFEIVPPGPGNPFPQIRFRPPPPDFENPTDANRDNIYEVQLGASDGVNIAILNFRVSIRDGNSGTIQVRRVATGLSSPMYVAGLPDGSGRIVILERAGRIRLFDPKTRTFAADDFLNLTGQVATDGERGLFGIAFSFGYNLPGDGVFYVYFSSSAGDNEVRRYKAFPNDLARADPSTADTILQVAQPAGLNNHKGGMFALHATGQLLIGLGDGGGTGDPQGNAQNPNSLLGKVLRINPEPSAGDAYPADPNRDYAIPFNNPFASGGGAPEIWAMGLRNPFRGSFDPVMGYVAIGDVGQDAVEEVDVMTGSQSGSLVNFGWSRREGTQAYNGGADSASFRAPAAEYLHGTGPLQGDSITGGIIYRGPLVGLQDNYFFADFVTNNIWSIPQSTMEFGPTQHANAFTSWTQRFTPDQGTIDSIVAFGADTKGNMYIVDFGGEIFMLAPID